MKVKDNCPYVANLSFSCVMTAAGLLSNSHSQTTSTRNPRCCSCLTLRESRVTLARNFSSQNSRLRFGVVARAHLCRCQKQP